MRANKEDLARLEKSLEKLINIDTTGVVASDLKQRLDSLALCVVYMKSCIKYSLIFFRGVQGTKEDSP